MSNTTSNAQNQVEIPSVASEKKRGRPPGSIREAFFCMAAIVDDEIVHELVQVTRGEKVSHEEMAEEANKIFKKKHKVEAESSFGPVFKASLMQTTTSKRKSIKIPEADINFTGRKIQAKYNGWEVIGRYIEDEAGNENTEVIRVFFVRDVENAEKGKKSRVTPQTATKFISDLKDIQELSSASEAS